MPLKKMMPIEQGFKIDSPDLLIPWDIDENELMSLVGKRS